MWYVISLFQKEDENWLVKQVHRSESVRDQSAGRPKKWIIYGVSERKECEFV